MSQINPTEPGTGGTVQFSLDKTRAVNLKKKAPSIGKIIDEEEEQAQEQLEEELLKNQATPTEFEDVFSDAEKQEDDAAATQNVVAIEEVFKQSSSMINEDFQDDAGDPEEAEPSHNPKLKRAAIIIGIVSGAIILAAIAIAAIILF